MADAQTENLTPPIDDPLKVQLVDESATPIPIPGAEPTPLPLQASVAPTTTSEQDLRSAGQRGINLIWETTQRNVAYATLITTLFVDASVALAGLVLGKEITVIQQSALMQLNTMAALVLGFYFGRTNHARIGDDPRRSNHASDPMDDR
jgi:hypothetical protein